MYASGPEQRKRPTVIARFVDGPRDGGLTTVLALESGQPPDILLTPGRPDWIYLLAGGLRRDGSLPYLYMPPSRAALVRSQGRRGVS
jgi:hypothetical protein